MALLLLQALPSPLSARAEPPQVRGRGRPGQPGGLGVVEAWLEGAEDGVAAWLEGAGGVLLPGVEGSREGPPCLAWTGSRGASVLSWGHLFGCQGSGGGAVLSE